jgi:hypothetical protein
MTVKSDLPHEGKNTSQEYETKVLRRIFEPKRMGDRRLEEIELWWAP